MKNKKLYKDIMTSVAQEVVQKNFRGNVFGQQNLYLNKEKLLKESSDFNLEEYIAQQKKLSEYCSIHGPLKF